MKIVKRDANWFPSIFDEFFTENRLDVPNYEKFSIPPVNIQENLTNFVIDLAVPGLKKENIAIEIEENVLKVSSEISEKKETEEPDIDAKFTRKEFGYRSFNRSFTLPETVGLDDIQATYENGVLKITLPKKEEEIAIKKMVEIS